MTYLSHRELNAHLQRNCFSTRITVCSVGNLQAKVTLTCCSYAPVTARNFDPCWVIKRSITSARRNHFGQTFRNAKQTQEARSACDVHTATFAYIIICIRCLFCSFIRNYTSSCGVNNWDQITVMIMTHDHHAVMQSHPQAHRYLGMKAGIDLSLFWRKSIIRQFNVVTIQMKKRHRVCLFCCCLFVCLFICLFVLLYWEGGCSFFSLVFCVGGGGRGVLTLAYLTVLSFPSRLAPQWGTADWN